MKKIGIHQSQYLPWPPYFKKIANVDHFVFMDVVQYQKNGVQNRNQIRNRQEAFWLTIPIGGSVEETIVQKKTANELWRKKHWNSIQSAYQRAPFWKLYAEELEEIYQFQDQNLFQINQRFNEWMIKRLAISTPYSYLSEIPTESKNSELILSVCKYLHATHYVSGFGGKNYLVESDFVQANIEIIYEASKSPLYTQFHGEFIPGLSMLDYIMNTELESIQNYLRS